MKNIQLYSQHKGARHSSRVFCTSVFAMLVAASCLLILPGCRNPVLSPSAAGSGTAGTGSLLLTIGEQGHHGRTIMPATGTDDFAEFHLHFTALTGGNTNLFRTWTTAGDTIVLDPGDWELRVYALLDNDEWDSLRIAASSDTLSFTIAEGVSLSRNVTLNPIEDGYGTFSWNISFPSDVQTVTLDLTRWTWDHLNDVEVSSYYSHYLLGGTSPIGTNASLLLAAGRYRVILTLENNAGERTVASRILHVYQNMVSHFSQVFTAEHFITPLLGLILDAWDASGLQWNLIEEGFSAGCFDIAGIRGIYSSNFFDIIDWFNYLGSSFPATIPVVDEEGLRALADAALIGIASENGNLLFAHYGNQTNAAAAIHALVRNGTFISLAWTGDNTVAVYIDNGAYRVEITFLPGEAVPGYSLNEQLQWLRDYAESHRHYLIELSGSETIDPVTSWTNLPTGRINTTITLHGIGAERFIGLSSNGSHFWIPDGVTLVLDNNITLQGHSGNNNHLVRVNSGGTLIMNAGSRIIDNTNSVTWSGAGVHVNSGGTFTMNGGEISGNVAALNCCCASGGGVRVDGGTFNMRGGTISGNAAWNGGGVNIAAGTFRMSDGIIHGNTARNNGASLNHAAGTSHIGTFDNGAFTPLGTLPTTNLPIHVINGVLQVQGANLAEQLAWLRDFAQSDGNYTIELSANEIIAPTTVALGTGQMLPTGRNNLTITLRGIGTARIIDLSGSGSHFWIPDGVTLVLDNNVTLQGRPSNTNHLIRVNSGGTLIMNAGSRITGNENATATMVNGGGGVRVNSGGTFTMNGGEISGNITTNTSTAWDGLVTASPGDGGGVRVQSGGTFNMRGGTISGNTGRNGGGVWNQGTFRIYNGTIYGNIARTTGASLNHAAGTSQHGTFDNGAFTSLGTLSTTSDIIIVVNGELQQGTGFSISFADFVDMAPDIPIVGPTFSLLPPPVVVGSAQNPAPLSGNAWAAGNITTATPDREVWFSFAVTAGITYRLWWNDSHQGSGIKTLDTAVAIFLPDGTGTTGIDSHWTNARIITPTQSGIVRIRFTAWGGTAIGTFGIVYSTGTVRPAVPTVHPPAITAIGPLSPPPPTITVANPTLYDPGSIRWFFQGTEITGDMVSGTHGQTLTLGPRIHGNLLSIGTHFLTVEVSVNGVPFSRRISFTVQR